MSTGGPSRKIDIRKRESELREGMSHRFDTYVSRRSDRFTENLRRPENGTRDNNSDSENEVKEYKNLGSSKSKRISTFTQHNNVQDNSIWLDSRQTQNRNIPTQNNLNMPAVFFPFG